MTARLLPRCAVLVTTAVLSLFDNVGAAAETAPTTVAPAVTSVPSLPECLVGGAVVDASGTLYYLGGARLVQGRFAGNAATVLRLAPGETAWSRVGEIPGRSGFSAALTGREIFFAGGADDRDQVSNRAFAWNVDTLQLREIQPMPAGWYQHGTAAIDGRLYVVGGGPRRHSDVEASRTLWMYTPATDTWSRRADLPIPMRNLTVLVHGGRIYAIGGHKVGPRNPGNAAQEYDPATDRWRVLASMPTPRTDIAAVVHGNRILVLGGHPSLSVVEAYDPATDRWQTLAPLSQGRFAPAAVARGSAIVVFAGAPNETEHYLPAAR